MCTYPVVITEKEVCLFCVRLPGHPAAAADGWNRIALRREKLADHDVGQIQREVELDNVLNGRTSLTAVPCTKATGPSGNPLLREMAWRVERQSAGAPLGVSRWENQDT
jgi:hypothetical protein